MPFSLDHGDGWTVTFDDPAVDARAEWMREAAAQIAKEGGGAVQMWINRPRPEHEHAAADLGLAPSRALYQMRRPLPYDLDEPDPDFKTRAFLPGTDEAAWVAVNNRAFSWHPEQGGWTADTVREREAEPWFDAEGFLIHEAGASDTGAGATETGGAGEIDGFCWTKIHADHDPPLGEIYVIAVDPEPAGGTRKPTPGLGRKLTAAGLDYMHRRRGVDVGMLYVDASNARAVKLYVDMGFAVNHIDQVFSGMVAPAR